MHKKLFFSQFTNSHLFCGPFLPSYFTVCAFYISGYAFLYNKFTENISFFLHDHGLLFWVIPNFWEMAVVFFCHGNIFHKTGLWAGWVYTLQLPCVSWFYSAPQSQGLPYEDCCDLFNHLFMVVPLLFWNALTARLWKQGIWNFTQFHLLKWHYMSQMDLKYHNCPKNMAT